MQTKKKNGDDQNVRLHAKHQKSMIWITIILIVAAGLYAFIPKIKPAPYTSAAALHSAPPSPPQAAMHLTSARIAPAPPTKVSKSEYKPQAAAKIALNMATRRPVTPKADFMAPRWSQDGLDILVTKGKYSGLYIVSPDGTNIRQISAIPGIGYNAHWSPDGKYVVVEQDDGTHYYDRSGEEVDADYVPPQSKSPVYAEDGVLYLRSENAQSDADQILMADEDQYFEPVASPDGSKVAYIGLESGIVIKDLKTNQDVLIGPGTDISWTPKGDGIVFNHTQDDGERIIDGEIYYASADGNVMKNLTNSSETIERRPNLSGDGSQLTYEAAGQIFTVNVINP